MIKLNIQIFGGRGSSSGGGGGGIGAGHNTGSGGTKESEKKDTGPVRKLETGETYDMYKIRNGKEELSDRNSSYEDTKELLTGYHPDANGIWKDKNGRAYRIVRSKR